MTYSKSSKRESDGVELRERERERESREECEEKGGLWRRRRMRCDSACER